MSLCERGGVGAVKVRALTVGRAAAAKNTDSSGASSTVSPTSPTCVVARFSVYYLGFGMRVEGSGAPRKSVQTPPRARATSWDHVRGGDGAHIPHRS
jgi:hypothetical protein